jgi:hypothetical protein
MNETNSWLGNTGTTSGNWVNLENALTRPITTFTDGSGLIISGNSTINYSNNLGSSVALTPKKDMTPKQVNVAVFTITRDVDTNEINSTKFLKDLWIEQKNGTSIDLLVAKQLGSDFDPETTIIKTISIVSF